MIMHAVRPLAILLLLTLAACGDEPTSSSRGPAYDLVFSAGGLLKRTRGAQREIRPLGGEGQWAGTGAAPSPDGTRLFFTAPGSSARPPFLVFVDAASDEPVELEGAPDGYEREAAWSPGGLHVVFTSHVDDTYGDIFRARVVGATLVDVQNITGENGGADVTDVTPAWSPDGTRVAFTSYRGGNPAIWIMNADGSQPVRLTPEGDWGDYFPTWSPAGDSIAFQRLDGQTSRIGIVGVAGGAPRFLELPGSAYSPRWAPDRPALAIAMRVEGGVDVHVVRTDGSILERIRNPGDDYLPAWIRRESRF